MDWNTVGSIAIAGVLAVVGYLINRSISGVDENLKTINSDLEKLRESAHSIRNDLQNQQFKIAILEERQLRAIDLTIKKNDH